MNLSGTIPTIVSALLSKDDGEKLEDISQARASVTNKGEKISYTCLVRLNVMCMCACVYVRADARAFVGTCIYVNMRVDLDVALINS